MGRVLFTATLLRGHIAKFHIPYLGWFKDQGWETWVAAGDDYPGGAPVIPNCDRTQSILERKARQHRAWMRASVCTDALWNDTPMAYGIMHRLAHNTHKGVAR